LPRGHARYDDPTALRTSDAIPITPQRWRAELSNALPDDAVIFSDIGGHMLFNLHHLCIGTGQRFVLNLGFGSMGHGTAAPIGAALADPGRPVFAIVGDACFTMNGMELLVAAEYEVPVTWIVENNYMHGITWHGSRLLAARGRPLESVRQRRPLDVAAIARAMGLEARVVERPTQMAEAVAWARERRAPTVIEVRVDGSIAPPLAGRVDSLAGFIRR
jgi:acetolactate synthase-1/2/3 large subunit